MSYIETILEADERVYYKAYLSLWKFGLTIFLSTFLVLTGLIPNFPRIFLYAGLFILFCIYIGYISTELAVTNKHVISKRGFIYRNTNEILIENVESIKVKQNIMGRIFNYGNIFVIGTGGTKAPIKWISKPMEFRKKFLEMRDLKLN